MRDLGQLSIRGSLLRYSGQSASPAAKRRLPWLGLLITLTCLLLSSIAWAGPKERAEDLMRDAMDQDYLATNFKAAEAKLTTALKVCEGDKCPKDVEARIHHHLGVVYAGGMNRHAEAVEQFKEMLKLSPDMALDGNFVTDTVQKAYDEAMEAVGPAPVTVDKAVAVLEEKPWAEQLVGTPIPVYVTIPEGVSANKVVTRYRAPGDKNWKEITLRITGEGYGGYIPCTAVSKAGEVLYFTTAFDENLDRVASAGSAAEPRRVVLKPSIDGRQPALPGTTPPDACPGQVENRLSCESNDDCPGDQACKDLYCVAAEEAYEPTADDLAVKNWFSLAFSPDLSVVQSTDDACSPNAQKDGTLSCFFSNGQYQGVPVEDGKSNSLKGGVGYGSMRVMVGYDRLIGQRLLIGARLGFAFLGHPERADGKKFNPFHGELRVTFHFANEPFTHAGVRPYVFAGGGWADSVARITTPIQNTGTDGQPEPPVNVDAYQLGGGYFAGAGLGMQYAVDKNLGMNIELGVRQMFPDSATVIAPSLGLAYGL
ncbi:MAG: tetratricopeptide repeat protein [Polyangiaceae bacterium]|nr:tetratricopeptide repeat protein [Myxococcales bacterium]MCB9589472.1 tetratricopeptide repeat protein [Polyangiaceae bacterium]MCB9609961.1 tetratricopeptide repeat protein [Polyangiaceae bacterium]